MNILDLVKMTSCSIFSVEMPKENFIEMLKNAEPHHWGGASIEIIENPLIGKKVIEIDGGIFLSYKVKYKKITKGMVENAIEQHHNKILHEADIDEILNELRANTPLTSEVYSAFYNTETKLLTINAKNKNSKLLLNYLVNIFDVVGIKSLIVSEKLSLQTRLQNFLTDGVPLFNYVSFDDALTLYRNKDGKEETISIGSATYKKDDVLAMLDDEYVVKSLNMIFENEMSFKFNEDLSISNIKFSSLKDYKKELTEPDGKAFLSYIQNQFWCLNEVTKNMILDFSESTDMQYFL